ncbi:hypothetical protein [Billgrantia gudaonensis]|uniref:Pre-peptidase C-terminal domain-containing protein n=1 Tax=Billgrantia gudaonensis TaxID=376427 RepID=A0A1G8Q2L0_9GAMM|nr:hypothetical protein [Halomonas gudaonensis]SDI98943.1 hypothetical protein SAMN04487954_102278 [Halomonas gudaonensis]
MQHWARCLVAVVLFGGLSGCAGIQDSRERAIELRPDESYEVMAPGAYLFTFTLDTRSRVVLESETRPGDFVSSPAGVLLDSEGREVARDWTSGRGSNFRIEEELPAGTWYLRTRDPHACLSVRHCTDRDNRYRVHFRLDEMP